MPRAVRLSVRPSASSAFAHRRAYLRACTRLPGGFNDDAEIRLQALFRTGSLSHHLIVGAVLPIACGGTTAVDRCSVATTRDGSSPSTGVRGCSGVTARSTNKLFIACHSFSILLHSHCPHGGGTADRGCVHKSSQAYPSSFAAGCSIVLPPLSRSMRWPESQARGLYQTHSTEDVFSSATR